MKQPLFLILINFFFISNILGQCLNDDLCSDIANGDIVNIDFSSFDGQEFECRTGCFLDANPDPDPLCGFADIPVIWFKVKMNPPARRFYVNVVPIYDNPGDYYNLVFAMFSGDCSDLVGVESPESPLCNLDWNNHSQINQEIDPDEEFYWIAVGAQGNEDDIAANPNFKICFSTTVELIACLGDLSCTPAANWELDSSSNPQQILGPIDHFLPPTFLAGEEITICSNFFYDATATGLDWFQGFVPIFGPAWDTDAFEPDSSIVIANGQIGQWFDEGIPTLQENYLTLCTYVDDFGNLQLCNSLCSPCPCNPGMTPNTPLPGGFFWVTTGAGCENDGTPSEGWGVGSITADIEFCMDLKVRSDLSMIACNNPNNLEIGFQAFSDGVTGCYQDPVGTCLLDENQFIICKLECGGNRIGWAEVDGVQEACKESEVIVPVDLKEAYLPYELVMEITLASGESFIDTVIFNNVDAELVFAINEDTSNNTVSADFEANVISIQTNELGQSLSIKNPEAISIHNVRNYSRRLKDYQLIFRDFESPEGFGDQQYCSSLTDTIFLPQVSNNDLEGFWVLKFNTFLDTIDYYIPNELEAGIFSIYFVLNENLHCGLPIDDGNDGYTLEITQAAIPTFEPFEPFCQFELNASNVPSISLEGIAGSWSIIDSYIVDTLAELEAHVLQFLPNLDCVEMYTDTIFNYTTIKTFYLDMDQDGFGDESLFVTDCFLPDGYVLNNEDCDDSNATINPEAIEICDGLDNNCDGNLDDGNLITYFIDNDLDGFGDGNNTIEACDQPPSSSSVSGDCDDTNPAIFPGAEEICDEVDNNCDGQIDEGVLSTYYYDTDMDGYGDAEDLVMACEQPPSSSLIAGDCDDTSAAINPDAEDIPNNGIDENCDGMDAISATSSSDITAINIYPNPTSGVIYLDSEISWNITIYDIQGREIDTQYKKNQVSLLGYPNGVYILNIIDTKMKNQFITKVIKL